MYGYINSAGEFVLYRTDIEAHNAAVADGLTWAAVRPVLDRRSTRQGVPAGAAPDAFLAGGQ
jgi:hypothetical protein